MQTRHYPINKILIFASVMLTGMGFSTGNGGNGLDSIAEAETPSLAVRGNGWLVANGDETPSQIDGTEFGPTAENGAETHTFIVHNNTSESISIERVALTGDASFSIDGSGFALEPGDESNLSVVFTAPETDGKEKATVTLEMSDGSYSWSLQGTSRAIWGDPLATEEAEAKWGRIQFEPEAVVQSDAAEEEVKAIAEIAAGVWRDFLLMDTSSFLDRVAPDLLRFSEQWGAWTVGLDNIIENIEFEWTCLDRPLPPVIASNFTIEDFEVQVNGDGAVATYALAVLAGSRWPGTESAHIFQAFSKSDAGWKLAVEHATWGVTNLEEGTTGHSFDWIYPVKDMDRATAFYEHFLGEPELSTSIRTTWRLGGSKFHLDTSNLAGYVNLVDGLPNGYAVIYTSEDIATERERLNGLGVEIGTEVLTDWGPDPYFVAMDPSGNPFVWMQRVGQHAPTGDAPGVTIENSENIPRDLLAEIESLFTDWAAADAESIGSRMSPDGIWWDAYGWARGRGPDAVEASMKAMFEHGSHDRVFDSTPSGLDIDLVASATDVRAVGAFTIVTLELDITGRGVHAFNEQASAAITWRRDGQKWKLVHSFIGVSDLVTEMALTIDYTGYPVDNLSAAESFYTDTMLFGVPYTDSGWLGWWYEDLIGNHGVFGVFESDPKNDGMPRRGETSGYISFSIKSAKETFDKLKSLDATFPSNNAIGSYGEIADLGAYTQVYTLDPEGNGLLFTEYSGE